MCLNFYTDNASLQFYLRHIDINDAICLREKSETTSAAIEQYRAKLEEIGRIAAEIIAPNAEEIDRKGVRFAEGQVKLHENINKNLDALKQANVLSVVIPREYNGLNFPTTIYAMMTEIISRADASMQNIFGLQSVAETILAFASEDLKKEILPKFASGELDSAMCLTEPDAGSDLQSVQTSAVQGEDGVWRLNGLKHFITNGTAKVMLVLARSEEGTRDARGLSMFLVRQCPEVTITRIERKLGIHGSPTCELSFNNAPAELIGKRKMGLIRYVMYLMNSARLSIGAQSVGILEAIRRTGWEYCRSRRQFGRPLSEIAPVNEMLTRMDALTAASRAILYETAKYVDLREAWTLYSAEHPSDRDAQEKAKRFARFADCLTPIAKAFNAEAANKCAYDCIQCLGGKGYMEDYPAERYFRDARITSIYEGTTQMQVVAAVSGIMKGGMEELLSVLDAFEYSTETKNLLEDVSRVRSLLFAKCKSLSSSPEFDLLSRRMVRGMSIILASMLLLKNATMESEQMEYAVRFIREYLPDAEMQVHFLCPNP